MKEALDAQLVELLTKVNSGIESTAQFSAEQMPELIEQTLVWYQIYYIAMFVLAIASVAAIYPTIRYGIKAVKKLHVERISSDHVIGTTLSVALLAIIELITFSENINLTWLQIYVAPKLWLVEYLSSMAK